MSTKTIVLIHGLSVSKHSWAGWAERFASRGYNVITPAYHPDLDRSLAELKNSPLGHAAASGHRGEYCATPGSVRLIASMASLARVTRNSGWQLKNTFRS